MAAFEPTHHATRDTFGATDNGRGLERSFKPVTDHGVACLRIYRTWRWGPGSSKASTYPGGRSMWVSDVMPGNSAAQVYVLAATRSVTDKMPALAVGGYEGTGHGVLTR